MTTTKLSIVDQILADQNFTSILKCYKNDLTKGYKLTFSNEYRNGLCETLFVITINNKPVRIILPIFSSMNTITWNNAYLNVVKNALNSNDHTWLTGLQDHEIVDLIECPLYFYDEVSKDIAFLAMISAHDFVHNGTRGRNGHSTYFWNKDLPNKYSKNKKQLVSDVFVMCLPHYSKKEIKDICQKYAEEFHKRFADTTQRSTKTKIKNIATGLYAQIMIYLNLLKAGENVTMDWVAGDDLGIDIVVHKNGKHYNIDVKSTSDTNLKITKNRQETDMYAVVDNTKDPYLIGYVFKFDFWKSDITGSKSPELVNDIYVKPINKLNLQTLDGAIVKVHEYDMKKKKKATRLFNAQ